MCARAWAAVTVFAAATDADNGGEDRNDLMFDKKVHVNEHN